MSIRLRLAEPSEEARAELARLESAQRRTYLGVSVWLWLGWAVLALALSAAVVRAGLFPSPTESGYWECAVLLEAGDWDAAGCVSEWPDLDARSRELWGPDGDPETGGEQ